MNLVRVALAVPLFQFFDYLLPEEMQPVRGGRVLVPFGRQQRVGIVVDFPAQSEVASEQLKPICQVLDEENLFNEPLWQLIHWAANYYQAPLGEALFQALPVKLRQGESAVENDRTFLRITPQGEQALRENLLKRAKKQQEALQLLAQSSQEKGQTPFASNIWHSLKEKGYVEEYEQANLIRPWQALEQPIVNEENKHRLNKEQALALGRILFHQGFAVWLIDGVTGSGKTEIYLQTIEETLKKGQQVLVLVPEIGLTPQTVQRFQARFNVEIDVLHSNLNDTQRLRAWQRAKSGQSAVVIGTRSALFTQFSNLGLLVIDEEHDGSFKQQEGWRYHARDLAVVYAKLLNIPILLGSATPSLESLNNVKLGKYQHLILQKRAGNSTALQQFVIDLKHQRIQNGLSDALANKMQEHLQQGNQVLLFLNRRGFAPVLFCHECGWIATCQHCEKPYTYHQHQRVLRCHHCSSQKSIPMQCGHCGSTHLMTTGLGTEQLEETLKQRFPDYVVTRIDRDSTARKGTLEKHLQDIQQGKSQILIGTQMLAKGHHFPNVTLVGLLNVDNALFSLDFRAEERLAQLYVQVAGRAGRSEKHGQVVLQTHYPDHPLLRSLLKEGYGEFAQQALHLREQMGLPPYSSQALFRTQSRHSEQAEQFLQQIAATLQHLSIEGLQIYGPMPAPFSKKAGAYRWQLLVQHSSRAVLHQALSQFQANMPQKSHQVRWILDVDPLDLT
ncbi:primosomal protein N' [Avibacterium paragallinarum]|uniref:Replication restart protein PriA n=1 Tax=Avibacterium paragallinarum TaxID=728 RepID=A0A0F5EYK6_AVIPA|nr:primosomal protein N' [Avibacterium paragallinarum]KAA6208480.1 primosomal protein N' [Avibacterium paragallinarum]KKB01683.1 primosomal protein N' [Avibacterium paragallinarum]RZN58101.1 primosomal protein N' [Avibacterium paragallinarum]RZN69556.1 primosomal protein N' [Avibacterium paragallinarum]SUV40877.1 Primosomal protein N' [Avibacterium paragallinarum]